MDEHGDRCRNIIFSVESNDNQFFLQHRLKDEFMNQDFDKTDSNFDPVYPFDNARLKHHQGSTSEST